MAGPKVSIIKRFHCSSTSSYTQHCRWAPELACTPHLPTIFKCTHM